MCDGDGFKCVEDPGFFSVFFFLLFFWVVPAFRFLAVDDEVMELFVCAEIMRSHFEGLAKHKG